MSIKITIPNTSTDYLTFGSGNTPTAAQIAGIDSGSTNGQLAIYTTASGTSTERMRIDSSGNVLVGTTASTYNFQTTNAVIYNGTSAGVSVASGTKYLSLAAQSGGAGVYVGARSNDNLIFTTNDTERARIDTSGTLIMGQSSNAQIINVGDGATRDTGFYGVVQVTRAASPNDNRFHYAMVRNANTVGGMGYINNTNTLIIQNGGNTSNNGVTLAISGTSWGSSSDIRTKNILGNIQDGISIIKDWRTVYFKYKNDEEDQPQRVGLIAQDVQATLPEAIFKLGDEQQTLQLQYSDVIPVLVKAIQEQQALIQSLTDRLNKLENK